MPYLFDTSAARSVGRARLEAARIKGIELLLSPITFWELTCHLGDEPFGRPRGNVLTSPDKTPVNFRKPLVLRHLAAKLIGFVRAC